MRDRVHFGKNNQNLRKSNKRNKEIVWINNFSGNINNWARTQESKKKNFELREKAHMKNKNQKVIR